MRHYYEACKSGDFDKVNEIINGCDDEKIDINVPIVDGETGLHLASMNGHLNIVKCLIEANANIEAKDNNGYTPLLLACQKGHFAVVKFLIEEKANIEANTNYGTTPLLLACQYGHLEILKLLIQNEANVHATK